MIDYSLFIILPLAAIVPKMSIEFDTALPSIRLVQTLIKEGTAIELKLITGELLEGRLGWQDAHCLCLFDESERQVAVWRQAIAYLKPRS
jgi:host factor-I protein